MEQRSSPQEQRVRDLGKPVREDWRWFNQAVEARADYLKSQVVPPPMPPAPRSPADWLRRGTGISVVILAGGVAGALMLWAARTPTSSFSTAPSPSLPPSVPAAKVTVDYTRFVTVTLGDRDVVTGWKYNSSEDLRPAHQYCYVSIARSGSASLRIDLADTATGPRRYDANAMNPLTLAEFRTASLNCVWAPDTTLPRPKPVT